MSKLKTIGENPLDAVIPQATPQRQATEPAKTAKKRERITFFLSSNLIDKLRNTAFWSPGITMAEIVEQSVTTGLDRIEKQRGEPFPPRQRQLLPGRKVQAA